MILVGYTGTGYILLRPEEGKLCESRDMKFNEKLVFGDKYRKDSIQNWQNIFDETNRNKCNVQFENKENKVDEILEAEGVNQKRRGRPRKIEKIGLTQLSSEQESSILSK